MVQADIAQLPAECTNWRQTLRHLRNEFHEFQKQLRQRATGQLSKHQLQDLEHYENQFHIQLINIHDLKQAIKTHEQKLQAEHSSGHYSDETLSYHEDLFDRYSGLESTLQELKHNFTSFIK